MCLLSNSYTYTAINMIVELFFIHWKPVKSVHHFLRYSKDKLHGRKMIWYMVRNMDAPWEANSGHNAPRYEMKMTFSQWSNNLSVELCYGSPSVQWRWQWESDIAYLYDGARPFCLCSLRFNGQEACKWVLHFNSIHFNQNLNNNKILKNNKIQKYLNDEGVGTWQKDSCVFVCYVIA